jgi:CheY-like chemotaxis protein
MQPRASTRHVVLVVEDETLVRMVAIEAIEAAGFDVIETTDADGAIAILEQRSDIRLIFTDIRCQDRWTGSSLIATKGNSSVTAT